MRYAKTLILCALLGGLAFIAIPQFLSSQEAKKSQQRANRAAVHNVTAGKQVRSTDVSNVSGSQVAHAGAPHAGSDGGGNTNSTSDTESSTEFGSVGKIVKGLLPTGSKKSGAIRSSSHQVLGCVIEPDQTAEIGSPVIGVVSSIDSERGDKVVRNQELAHLRADVERASLQVAQARTQADAEVRAAQTNVDFLRKKLERAEELVEMNFVSKEALEEARADYRLAEERLAQALEQQHVWQRELELANAQLELRTIRAPFDGVIVNRYVSIGERIENEPLFRIVKTDPLRVEIVAPSKLFGTVAVGTIVTVMPELPSAPVLLAEVVLVDSVIDGASNTFRVRAKLPNPDGTFPSGLRCRAELSDLPVSAVGPAPETEPKEEISVDDSEHGPKEQTLDSELVSTQDVTIAAALGDEQHTATKPSAPPANETPGE